MDVKTLGVIIALVAAIGTITGVVLTRLSAMEAMRRQEVGVAEWMRDLRDWASVTIDVLSDAVYAFDGTQDPSSSDVRRYTSQLSALIDRGRFFLPNKDMGQDHTRQDRSDKPRAFQGLRHGTLAPLVAAVQVLEGKVIDDEIEECVIANRRAVLRGLQKEFVSSIQMILDPKGRNQEIAKLIQVSRRAQENRVEALLAVEGKVPPGRKGVLRVVVKRLQDQ